jgi:hypothetical protein
MCERLLLEVWFLPARQTDFIVLLNDERIEATDQEQVKVFS